jgi:hypothetical protein
MIPQHGASDTTNQLYQVCVKLELSLETLLISGYMRTDLKIE